jgi:hypothetical protein
MKRTKSMKRFSIYGAMLVLGVVVAGLIASLTGSIPGASAVTRPQVAVALGQPKAAAHLAQTQVLDIVRHEFGDSLLSHPFTVDYGSFTENNYFRSTQAGDQAVGTIDAWRVTIPNLTIPLPCGPAVPKGETQQPCQPRTVTLTVIIDDKKGQYLEAIAQ